MVCYSLCTNNARFCVRLVWCVFLSPCMWNKFYKEGYMMFRCMSLTSQVQTNWNWQVRTLITAWDSHLNEVSSNCDVMSNTNVTWVLLCCYHPWIFFFYCVCFKFLASHLCFYFVVIDVDKKCSLFLWLHRRNYIHFVVFSFRRWDM